MWEALQTDQTSPNLLAKGVIILQSSFLQMHKSHCTLVNQTRTKMLIIMICWCEISLPYNELLHHFISANLGFLFSSSVLWHNLNVGFLNVELNVNKYSCVCICACVGGTRCKRQRYLLRTHFAVTMDTISREISMSNKNGSEAERKPDREEEREAEGGGGTV